MIRNNKSYEQVIILWSLNKYNVFYSPLITCLEQLGQLLVMALLLTFGGMFTVESILLI